LKIVISTYLSCKSSKYDEIWYADANFDPGDGNVRKFRNSQTVICDVDKASTIKTKAKAMISRPGQGIILQGLIPQGQGHGIKAKPKVKAKTARLKLIMQT